jgi:hypothetical protein
MSNPSEPNISILPSARINRQLWDACVQQDSKGLIYATTAYLNQMAGQWYGLVVNDYEAVLPLPIKHIAGIRMVYTPPFFQRLDVVGKYSDAALEAIRRRVLNFAPIMDLHNSDPDFLQLTPLRKKTNFILRLNQSYAEIAGAYSKECKKNIAKAYNRGCVFKHGISIQEVKTFYQKAYGAKASYKEKHFARLVAMAESGEVQNYIHLCGVSDESSNSLIFAAILLDDGKRIYYLLGAPSEDGRKARATAFFIDQVVAQFAGKREVFDFEGSDIPDVASFYKGFSPETEYYYRFYLNRLPQPLRALSDKFLR